MKTMFSFCLLAIPLLTTSCETEDKLEECMGSCTTITGRLLTANGQQGIKGAQVSVKWIYGPPSWPKAKLKSQTTTDANGNYHTSFFIKGGELEDGFFEVIFGVDDKKYYTIGVDVIALYDAKRDTMMQLYNYIIPRKAYVRLMVTNPTEIVGYYSSSFNNCYGHNSTFSSQIQGGGPVINWSSLPLENPLPIAGDQPVLIRTSKIKNGVTIWNVDSLFVSAGATANYTVTY
ncbi:hypothetical protein H8B15_12940 [Hymenobacter sp. BT507]|uniref:Carboxypeptidase regulatory-like domain-containing protein n=1 Tax=Hymenobacter citatus TaxID=2763506 RepID=A0ABR7MLQ0_9BACT|nr:hypothetical protein [Hymenobacter citatus]MBC6611834.1 hypothetical protein [Hymenobacter citatus]